MSAYANGDEAALMRKNSFCNLLSIKLPILMYPITFLVPVERQITARPSRVRIPAKLAFLADTVSILTGWFNFELWTIRARRI